MSEIISYVLNFITIFISLTAIIIIVFDRIKNSVNLRKRVKTYYEAVENLIFNYYERGYIEELNENEEFKQIFYEHHSKWVLYENYVKNYFNDCAKYLGLVKTPFAYANNSSVFLSENFEWFYYMPKLETLKIENCTIKKDMNLAILKGLKEIIIHNSKIKEIFGIENIFNIDISNNSKY